MVLFRDRGGPEIEGLFLQQKSKREASLFLFVLTGKELLRSCDGTGEEEENRSFGCRRCRRALTGEAAPPTLLPRKKKKETGEEEDCREGQSIWVLFSLGWAPPRRRGQQGVAGVFAAVVAA